MNTSIYRYLVSYNFCGHRNEKEYKDLQNAAKNTLAKLNEYKNFSDIKDSVCISQVEYASEKNLKNGFSLQVTPIWSNGFHDIDDLKVLAGESEEDGSYFTHRGEIISLKTYAEMAKRRLQAEESN